LHVRSKNIPFHFFSYELSIKAQAIEALEQFCSRLLLQSTNDGLQLLRGNKILHLLVGQLPMEPTQRLRMHTKRQTVTWSSQLIVMTSPLRVIVMSGGSVGLIQPTTAAAK